MTEGYTAEAEQFARDGYVVLRGFYDRETIVEPIQEGIRQIVERVCHKYGVSTMTKTSGQAMGPAYMALAKANRSWGGEVYDAVKQIPAFMRLVSDARNDTIFRAMRLASEPGLAAGGYGIRIDSPGEDKFRASWHQEFPAQLRSLDGIVFWSPLVEVTAEIGPVEIATGSQREGVVPVFEDDGGIGKSGAYALRLKDEAERLARYPHIAPVTEPGDLILMDFLTLHRSGVNVSSSPRWSMQWRMFNFADPVGIKLGWKNSFSAGENFEYICADFFGSTK
jgi:hypothetical protein